MTKFGAKKEGVPQVNLIAQIGIVLDEDGNYKTAIEIVPGAEEEGAMLLLSLTNNRMYGILFTQLAENQPIVARKVAEHIKKLSEDDAPIVKPTAFGRQLLSNETEQ